MGGQRTLRWPRLALMAFLLVAGLPLGAQQLAAAPEKVVIEVYSCSAGSGFAIFRESDSDSVLLDYIDDPSGVFEYPIWSPCVLANHPHQLKAARATFDLIRSRWGSEWRAPRREDFDRLLTKETMSLFGIVPSSRFLVRVRLGQDKRAYWYDDTAFRAVLFNPRRAQDPGLAKLTEEFPEWGAIMQCVFPVLYEIRHSSEKAQLLLENSVSRGAAKSGRGMNLCDALTLVCPNSLMGVSRETVERIGNECQGMIEGYRNEERPQKASLKEQPLPLVMCWVKRHEKGGRGGK